MFDSSLMKLNISIFFGAKKSEMDQKIHYKGFFKPINWKIGKNISFQFLCFLKYSEHIQFDYNKISDIIQNIVLIQFLWAYDVKFWERRSLMISFSLPVQLFYVFFLDLWWHPFI